MTDPIRKKIPFSFLVSLMKGEEVTLATGERPSVELFIDPDDDRPRNADDAADMVKDEWENGW